MGRTGNDAAETLWELFEQESETYLAHIESLLSRTARDLEDAETMGALFRAFHSLKGVSASLGLAAIEMVAHRGEDLLDLFRNGEAKPDEASRELLLLAADTLVSLREACLNARSDVPGDEALVASLTQAKARLRGGAAASPPQRKTHTQAAPAAAEAPQRKAAPSQPAARAASPPAREPIETPVAAAPRAAALQMSKAAADPSELEFRPDIVQPFSAVVKGELGTLAEALESPTLAALDTQEIAGSLLAIREAASEAGYLGITDVLNETLGTLEDVESLDRTALTRGLCVFVHRLRILSELAVSGLSMEDVDDSLAPHISREARDVVDRLSVEGGLPSDWELVGILARALGVHRISALARLTSELTIQDGWRSRPGAMEVIEEIRRESQVIAIEGLDVSSLDIGWDAYDRLRDQMALLLTNAEAAVADLREALGAEIFNSLSPDARKQAADFLRMPGAALLEVRARLPEGDPAAQALMARLYEERVISNRVLVDVDPDLYQFVIGVTGSPEQLLAALRAMEGAADALEASAVLARGEAAGEPAAEPAAGAGDVLRVADDAWEVRLPSSTPAVPAGGPAVPEPEEWVPATVTELTPPSELSPAIARDATEAPLVPVGTEVKVRAERLEQTPSKGAGQSSLRVSSELVDSYLDSVAELRLCLSRLEQGASEAGFASTTAELRSAASQTSARTAERLRAAAQQIDNAGKVIANQIARAEATLRMLHSVTLELRVVPISIVLGRMPRLVRDLARSLGKQVNLEVEDGDIQIDKSMVDALMEPMVHMIRNAMDHGLETPEERLQAGKPEKGTLTLRATQNGNVARIMIADDGRGLKTAVIRAKAIERGLISEQDAGRMSEREIQRLIFAPGFSTASAITETSGRGVGMDVVLVTIRRLGGSIDIDSVEGEGTRFYLNFPVSAALQRIVVVTDGERDLGLPERAIVEVIEVDKRDIQTVGELAGIQHRDGFLPVRSIETMLGWETPDSAARQTVCPVVIIGTPERRVGVAVSRVRRRQEVFMKELHPALNAIDVLAGATVMGEGQPLLVLDPETLIAIAGA